MVKVSVIIPVYNCASYIRECIESIMNQTLKEIEIICVDDGSTDQSYDILEEYSKKDTRIHIIKQRNMFAGVARNNGMKLAKGKYLSFLDADDYFKEDMLEKMYCCAEKNALDVTICEYFFHSDSSGDWMKDYTYEYSFIPELEIFRGSDLKKNAIFQFTNGWAWDKLFRADFVKKNGYVFSDFCTSEDGFFVYMLLAKAKRIGIVHEKLAIHRIENAASLSNSRETAWENGFRMIEEIRKQLEKEALLNDYEESFMNFSVKFIVWHINTLSDFQALKKCISYLKEKMEPFIAASSFAEEKYWEKKAFKVYKQFVQYSFEEYLFEYIKKLKDEVKKKIWPVPYMDFTHNSIVVLYGAGRIGNDYYEQLLHSNYCKKIVWIDQNYEILKQKNKNIKNPEIIETIIFDVVIVAIQNKEVQEEIRNWLLSKGVEENKIILPDLSI